MEGAGGWVWGGVGGFPPVGGGQNRLQDSSGFEGVNAAVGRSSRNLQEDCRDVCLPCMHKVSEFQFESCDTIRYQLSDKQLNLSFSQESMLQKARLVDATLHHHHQACLAKCPQIQQMQNSSIQLFSIFSQKWRTVQRILTPTPGVAMVKLPDM